MTDRDKLIELCKDLETLPCCDTYEGQADHLIANGVTVGDANNATTTWRHANEPPKEAGYYLVAVKNEHGRKYTKSTYYHGNGHWFANQSVTHWIPLPQPPKEVE